MLVCSFVNAVVRNEILNKVSNITMYIVLIRCTFVIKWNNITNT